jgi:beta-lactamase superfamily II metal-dependent hydrolase
MATFTPVTAVGPSQGTTVQRVVDSSQVDPAPIGAIGGLDGTDVGTETPSFDEPLPGGDGPPMDLDEDGRYEDVNGNGRLDFNDPNKLFNKMSSSTVQNNPDAFDFNGNGRVDFNDIVALQNEVSAVNPELEVDRPADIPRNGSVTLTLTGHVSEAELAGLTKINVSVDGTVRNSSTLSVNTSTERGNFRTSVELTEGVHRVTVSVPGIGNTTRGTTEILLDGDGLSQTFERTVTGTDPMDPDSDANITDRDESDDGVVDGAEDYDGDTLRAVDEARASTSVTTTDTDGDALSDGFEVRSAGLDPTAVDTDGDGIVDGEDDADADGLSNRAEKSNGTRPGVADTDGDGVNDSAEVKLYDTDALAADTDEDGLPDGEELSLGTDPTNSDGDRDGVVDGNETFTTTARNDSLSVSATFEGQGDIASSASIESTERRELRAGVVQNVSVSPAVELETSRSFDSARVSFEYNDSVVTQSDESMISVFRYNETARTFVPVDSTVDTENDTVSATTSRFSTFAALPVDEWKQTHRSVPSPWSVVENERFSVDGANGQAVTYFPPFGASTDVRSGRSIRVSNDGRTADTLRIQVRANVTQLPPDSAVQLFLTGDSVTQFKTIAINDGGGDVPEAPETYTIEATDVSDRNLTAGVRVLNDAAITVDQINASFDTDGDGLSDKVERSGFPVGLGHSAGEITTSPLEADTDNDGLSDEEELGGLRRATGTVSTGAETVDYNYSYYTLNSDPTDQDTDDDRLVDRQELALGADPMDPNTDDDQFTDFVDPEPTKENLPANVSVRATVGRAGLSGDLVTVAATDESRLRNVTVRLRRPLLSGTEGYSVDPNGSSFQRQRSFVALLPGSRLLVTATDEHGNSHRGVFQVQPDGTRELVRSEFSLADGTITAGASPNVSGARFDVDISPARGVPGAAMRVRAETNAPLSDEGVYDAVVPGAAVADTEQDLVIPEGFVDWTPIVDESFTRGYGWRFLQSQLNLNVSQRDTLRSKLLNGNYEVVRRASDPVDVRQGSGPSSVLVEPDTVPKPPTTVPKTPTTLLKVVVTGFVILLTVGGGVLLSAESDRDDDPEKELEVHFIDVGQGQSTLIRGPHGRNVLVDAGSRSSDANSGTIQSVLQEEGVSTIDKLVLTHNHSDHVNLVPELINDQSVEIETVYVSGITSVNGTSEEPTQTQRDLTDALEGQDVRELRAGGGHRFDLHKTDIDVLNPPRDESQFDRHIKPSDDRSKYTDSNAIVLEVSYSGETVTLPSDIRDGREGELSTTDLPGTNPSTGRVSNDVAVLQASHHGSKAANGKDLLERSNPRHTVISASATASLPTDETLHKFESREIPTYWTAVHGDVKFIVQNGYVVPNPDENSALTDAGKLRNATDG